jgi:hypothetical protein
MTEFVTVQVRSLDGKRWDQVSRYRPEDLYPNGRRQGRPTTGRQMADEDSATFSSKRGYGRPSRVVAE